jgi:Flp pilus assembly pilin Flp
MKKMLKFFKDEEGIEIVEWGLMAALFALGVAVAIVVLQGGVSTFFNSVAGWFNGVSMPPNP